MVQGYSIFFPDRSCFEYSKMCEVLVCKKQDNESNEMCNKFVTHEDENINKSSYKTPEWASKK